MQSGRDGIPLEGDMLGVTTTKNGHQEEAHLEGNRQSEIEDPPEVVQREGEIVGVNIIENGHQEEARLEGNNQSEIEDPPEVVQREDSQSRVVSEQTDQVNDSHCIK